SFASERSRDVQVARLVECHTLRPSQTAVESADRTVWINFVDTVKAGSRWPCNHQIALRIECKVISRDAGFKGRKHKYLLITPNLEDGSTAVADIKILRGVKCNSRRHPHALGECRHRAVWRNAVDRSVIARRNVHLAFTIERDCRSVHHVGYEGLHV